MPAGLLLGRLRGRFLPAQPPGVTATCVFLWDGARWSPATCSRARGPSWTVRCSWMHGLQVARSLHPWGGVSARGWVLRRRVGGSGGLASMDAAAPGSGACTCWPPWSPALLPAPLECRRRGCGGQPGAWHLVIKSSGVDRSRRLQGGCGFEGAAPRGLGHPPPGPAAPASASPSWPLRSEVRGASWPEPTAPPEGEGTAVRWAAAGPCPGRLSGLRRGWGQGSPADTWQVQAGSASLQLSGLGLAVPGTLGLTSRAGRTVGSCGRGPRRCPQV